MEHHGVSLPGSRTGSRVIQPVFEFRTWSELRGNQIAVLWEGDPSDQAEIIERHIQETCTADGVKCTYFGARVVVPLSSWQEDDYPSATQWWAVIVQFEEPVSYTWQILNLYGPINRISRPVCLPHWVETPKCLPGSKQLDSWIDSWQSWITTWAEKDQDGWPITFGKKIDICPPRSFQVTENGFPYDNSPSRPQAEKPPVIEIETSQTDVGSPPSVLDDGVEQEVNGIPDDQRLFVVEKRIAALESRMNLFEFYML
ncbi:hypothetical protein Plec18170_009712 [Paecilomyces lecythidis]